MKKDQRKNRKASAWDIENYQGWKEENEKTSTT